MNLEKHIIDTMKEWQLKIGYREGTMKLYYPGESLVALLMGERTVPDVAGGEIMPESVPMPAQMPEAELLRELTAFCDKMEPKFGRIKISGSYERYCLDIPAKGCAYVVGKVPEPEFLKLFLGTITGQGSTMNHIRDCFAEYAKEHGTVYVEEVIEEQEVSAGEHTHSHAGRAFYFEDDSVEEYVYWVEENEFGLTYHRFTKADYIKLNYE